MAEKILEEIKDALIKGDRQLVANFTKKALDEGLEIKDILDKGLIAGMEIVGNKFKANEVFIPEVLISAKAMHSGMDILRPHFVKCGIKPIGKVVIGTVKGDLHDIGKNIVSMMLKGSCFEVEDYGIDVSVEKFVDAAKKDNIDVIALSSLLTTSMNAMRDTIKAAPVMDGRGRAADTVWPYLLNELKGKVYKSVPRLQQLLLASVVSLSSDRRIGIYRLNIECSLNNR